MSDRTEYKCNHCNKLYSSYKSRWLHIKKYHTNDVVITMENEGIINIKCDKCNFKCSNLKLLKEHNTTDCRPSVNSNNIYKFKADTLGKNKYKGNNGGDIYIIQTEFNLKGYYKIGISTNLYQRLQQYRCGAVLEPKLHYYYPCKNIKDADKILKEKLSKFNIKREIYKTDNLIEIREIIKTIQNKMNSEILEIEPETKECEIQSCNYCDIYFTNSLDLNIHIKENHKEIYENVINYGTTTMKNNQCKYCNKILCDRMYRWKHEIKCKNKILETNQTIETTKIIEEMKKQNNELKLILKQALKNNIEI